MSGRSMEDWAGRSRAEGPFLLLAVTAAAALPTVAGQRGSLHQGCVAALAVLAAPAAAIGPMLAIAWIASRLGRLPR